MNIIEPWYSMKQNFEIEHEIDHCESWQCSCGQEFDTEYKANKHLLEHEEK